MNRREFLPLALLALPEITVPTGAEERLTQAVEAWSEADTRCLDLAAALEASTRQLRASRGLVPAHRLRVLVEARRVAREELLAGQRALAEAEQRLDMAARLGGGGK